MKANISFDAVLHLERFRVTARAAEPYSGGVPIQLLVEDTTSGSAIEIGRAELMPLLRVIREVVKAVDDAAAGLPSDPVERAARRMPSKGLAHSLQRGYMLKAYRQELRELQERVIKRFDDITHQINQPDQLQPPASLLRPPLAR